MGKPPPVNETTLTATSVFLTWEPPADPNGDIAEYRINILAISTDPGVGMGGGTGGRRKRQSPMNPVNPDCIRGGASNADRNMTTPGTQTSLSLIDLSELNYYIVIML